MQGVRGDSGLISNNFNPAGFNTGFDMQNQHNDFLRNDNIG